MGFCLFNNVAVTAGLLAAQGERVMVLDWDAHHGNGTQELFYERPDVLYVSLHQFPFYPGTGSLSEVGAGDGRGATVNLPFPAGTAGDTYRLAFDEVVVPLAEEFAPSWLLVSAGFDAHRDDPLTDLGLTAGDFVDLTVEAIATGAARAADRVSRRRVRPRLAGRLRRRLRDGARRSGLSTRAGVAAARSPSALERSSRPPAGITGQRSPGERRTTSDRVPERLRPILEVTRPVAERFQAAGKQVFLVGGPVRDGIAGRPGGVESGSEVDIDLTTDATPDEIEALVSGARGGRVDSGEAVRDHRAAVRGSPFRDHDAPGRGLRARLPQARGPFRPRYRDGPVAAGLHRQRDGAQPA